MKKIHKINEKTRELIGEEFLFKDSFGNKLIPPNTTEVNPLPGKKGFTQVFNNKKNVFEYAVDKRGTEYYPEGSTHDTRPSKITKLGVDLPEGATLERPAKDAETLKKEAVSAANAETERILNELANAYGYDSIISARGYNDGGDSIEAKQARAFIKWSREVWADAYKKLTSGTIPSVNKIIEIIPKPDIPGTVIFPKKSPFGKA